MKMGTPYAYSHPYVNLAPQSTYLNSLGQKYGGFRFLTADQRLHSNLQSLLGITNRIWTPIFHKYKNQMHDESNKHAKNLFLPLVERKRNHQNVMSFGFSWQLLFFGFQLQIPFDYLHDVQ